MEDFEARWSRQSDDRDGSGSGGGSGRDYGVFEVHLRNKSAILLDDLALFLPKRESRPAAPVLTRYWFRFPRCVKKYCLDPLNNLGSFV